MKKHLFFYFIIIAISLGIVAFTSYESLVQISKLKSENAKLQGTMNSYAEKIDSFERNDTNQETQISAKDQRIKDLEDRVESLHGVVSDQEPDENEPAPSSDSQSTNAGYDTISPEYPTLYSLAKKNGITVDELMRLNGLTADSVVQMGQQLRVK